MCCICLGCAALFANRKKYEDIDTVFWSARTYNALKNANINTFADLCKCTEAQLLREKPIGRKSLNEIKARLAARNLELAKPRWNT